MVERAQRLAIILQILKRTGFRIFKLQLQDKVIILRHMLYSNLNSFRSTSYPDI